VPVPARTSTTRASRPVVRRRRWRRLAAAGLILVVILAVATGRLFIWPAQGAPSHVDAIVVLGGPGDRLGKGLELAARDRAPVLAISEGLEVPPSLCRPRSQAPRVICFQPDPLTTQGEAQAAARLARQYGWRSIVLVTTPDQDTRARIRFERCFSGGLYVETTPLPASQWIYQLAYQWAATAKALVLQRSC
jgi:uncharacterized SAM-binding protein YcdF (DUF218 family)